jgi:hypothetical protein
VRAGIPAIDQELNAGDGSARSYSFDDQSASYAVACRLLPHRLLSIVAWLFAGITVTATLAVAETNSPALCQWLGIQELPAIQSASPNSVCAWLSNIMLIVAALLCWLIYGLRRHRLDDFRGKYRRWLAATGVCILASLLLSTNSHHSLAHVAATVSGFTALSDHAMWWLLPAALIVGWVSIRVAFDMRRCRFGIFSLFVAAGLFLSALAGYFNILPTTLVEFSPSAIMQLAGHVWVVIALLAQVRYILLEASGEIPVSVKPALKISEEPPAKAMPTALSDNSASTQRPVASPIVTTTSTESRKSTTDQQPVKKSLIAAAKGETKWIDGRSSRDADDYEDEGRPLSKAEKKRLRKEQARRAA